jgi:PKD repeat protein
MRGVDVRRRIIYGATVLATIASGVLMTSSPAYAAPCSSVSHFKPQIKMPVGEGIDSPGFTDAAEYEGVMDFGDGTTIPVSLHQPFSHRFSKPGTYTVASTGRGRVFTTDGGSTPCEETRFVLTTVTVYPLEAKIAVVKDGESDGGGARYTFDGSGSIPAGEITDYIWDFGDGSYGDGPSTSHAYATPGSFTVELGVLDSNGYAASASKTVSSGEVVTLDASGAPLQPELDPNEFVAGGSVADSGSDGGGSGLLIALLLGGALLAAGAVAMLLRARRPAASSTEGRPDQPGPTPEPTPSLDAPSDLPETVGDSGMVYADDRKRTKAVKGADGLVKYYENVGDEVSDSLESQHQKDAKRREELIEHYRTYQGMSQADAEFYADRDLASYGNNMGMVPEVAKDVLYDAPIETVKEKWKWLGDAWNKAFPPKP